MLTYHVVPGRYDKMAIDNAIRMAPGGKLSLKTIEGDTLTLANANGTVWVTDAKGNTARVTIPDVYQSNGVIMVVDKVLMP